MVVVVEEEDMIDLAEDTIADGQDLAAAVDVQRAHYSYMATEPDSRLGLVVAWLRLESCDSCVT